MFNPWKKKLIDFKNIVIMGGIGILALGVSLLINEGLVKIFIGTISSYFIVSSILDYFNKSRNEEILIEKVCDCVNGESCAGRLGVINLSSTYSNGTYNILEETKKSIDIMHVYGEHWTRSNRQQLIDILKNKSIKVRVILADYEDEITINTYNRQYNTDDIKDRIGRVVAFWKDIYKQSGSKENLELYLFPGVLTAAIYINENKAVALHFLSSKNRHLDEMTEVVAKKVDKGLYDRYKKEIQYVIDESRIVALD
ncbi:hypothetical protein [Clostridium paraputrificum]